MIEASMETASGAGSKFGLRTVSEMKFARLVALAGLVIGLRYYAELWIFEPNGLSRLSDRLPYWDFTNLWAGARLALHGHVGWLFDLDAYRAALRAMFTPLLPNQEWSYPPSMLLFGLPLATLPIFWAYVAWTLGTVIALHFSLRLLNFPRAVHLFLLASPSVVISAIFGQNGSLTTALIIGALALSPTRPVLAGIFAGLLTIKPHLGILIPVAYLAAGNWRAFLSAAATGIAMVILTGALFGFDVWILFIDKTRPLMAAIMEAPYPQLYHANALTFFILGRSMGLDVTGSYALQAVFTILAVCLTARIWRKSSRIGLELRVILTALLAISATPYGYTYDTVAYSVAAAWLYLNTTSPNRYIFAILWIYPYLAHLLNFQGIGVGILLPAGLAAFAFVEMRRRKLIDPAIAA